MVGSGGALGLGSSVVVPEVAAVVADILLSGATTTFAAAEVTMADDVVGKEVSYMDTDLHLFDGPTVIGGFSSKLDQSWHVDLPEADEQ